MKKHLLLEIGTALLILTYAFYVQLQQAVYVSADSNPGTNISFNSGEYWAWNDLIGWMDLHNTHTVYVTSTKVTGYASSSMGEISFDCATTPAGNICGSSNYNVIHDGAGLFSGWGWNDFYGWISFCGGASTTACPGNVNYRVQMNVGDGIFSGYAWNDAAGWISFNCSDSGICGTSNYKVVANWSSTSTRGYIESNTFDTGLTNGAQLNSFIWRGVKPAGTVVEFQFAGSNSSGGPWNYKGPDGTVNTYYSGNSDTSIGLNYSDFNNYRYFRYKVWMNSDVGKTASPNVDEVLINWSP